MRLVQLLENITTVRVCADCEVGGIVSDSRRLRPGDLFVCIAGEHFDGHTAASEMLAQGAAAVVTQRDLGLERQVIVPDTRAALNRLFAAYYGYPASGMKLLGVTGTSGKTSTAFLLHDLLERLGKKTGLIGTVKCLAGSLELPSNQTTPEPEELQRLFRLMADAGCEYAVMEVSSQALAQGRVDGCRFEAAGFTNFSQDHLDYHGSMQAYLDAKKPLFAMTAHTVTNADDAHGAEAVERFAGKALTYSVRGAGELNASDIRTSLTGTSFRLTYHGCTREIRLPLLGEFSVCNASLAAGMLLEAGFAFDDICAAFDAAGIIPGRLEQLPTGGDFTVLLDYAHKPDAVEKVLKTVRGFCTGRIVIVFGCGGDRDRQKRPIMGRLAEELADYVYVTSDNPRHEDPDAIIAEIVAGMSLPQKRTVIPDRREAIRAALKNRLPGDCIILAGKGHETYQKIGDRTLHFDEREVVAQLLNER